MELFIGTVDDDFVNDEVTILVRDIVNDRILNIASFKCKRQDIQKSIDGFGCTVFKTKKNENA